MIVTYPFMGKSVIFIDRSSFFFFFEDVRILNFIFKAMNGHSIHGSGQLQLVSFN